MLQDNPLCEAVNRSVALDVLIHVLRRYQFKHNPDLLFDRLAVDQLEDSFNSTAPWAAAF